VVEIREFAQRVLYEPALDAKLAPPSPDLTDVAPGEGGVPREPGRAPAIAIERDTRKKRKVPRLEGFADPAQRVRILHALANHELQALELFAFALLEFPQAPPAFRRGLLRILAEEQIHFTLYRQRMNSLGTDFGDFPLSGYFWTRAQAITTALEFVATMCLTFENANLDHACDLEAAAERCGDEATAAALRVVRDDEISHVRFGLHWLAQWKSPGESDAAAWRRSIVHPLRPELARGDSFREDLRRDAGFDEEFIAVLRAAERPRALYRFDPAAERPDSSIPGLLG
jgi:uncharacterized ferritin-like protein (DUF455 family)